MYPDSKGQRMKTLGHVYPHICPILIFYELESKQFFWPKHNLKTIDVFDVRLVGLPSDVEWLAF